MKFFHLGITKHARERYIQRFTEPKNYRHIDECSLRRCNQCEILRTRLHYEANRRKTLIDLEMQRRVDAGTEEKWHRNNSQFMDFLCLRYGFGRMHFIRNEDCLFIIQPCPKTGNPVIVTVHRALREGYIYSQKRVKFRKTTA